MKRAGFKPATFDSKPNTLPLSYWRGSNPHFPITNSGVFSFKTSVAPYKDFFLLFQDMGDSLFREKSVDFLFEKITLP